jgi:O-antigen/teichoic acid export membrane protein
MSARRSRFVGNTAVLVVSTVLATALTLAQMKILAAALTLSVFGLFASLRGLSLLIAMLAANGFPQVLTRFLPVYAARGQRTAATRTVASALALAVVLCGFLVAGAVAARGVFFGSVPPTELDANLLLWFAVTTFAVTIKLVLYGGFNGLRRFGSQTLFETGALALQVGWMALEADALTLSRLFEIVGVTSLVTALAALPWFADRLRRDVPAPGAGAQAASSYRGYWLGAAGLSVVALAFTDADRWVLSNVLALEALSLFHVASRIARLANRFIAIPVLAFQPEVTRVHSEGRPEVVELSTQAFFKASVMVSVFAAVAIGVYAEELIALAANDAYAGARTTLWFLAASIPLSAMTAPLTAVMKALDGVRAALYCDLAWACVYLILLLALAGPLGVVGAGVAQLVACAVQLALAVRLATVRPRLSDALASLLKSLACAIAAFAPVAILTEMGAPHVVGWVLAAVAFWIYVRGARRLAVLTHDERARLVQAVTSHGFARGLAWWMP